MTLRFRAHIRLIALRTELAYRIAPWLADQPAIIHVPVPVAVYEMCECDQRIAHAMQASA